MKISATLTNKQMMYSTFIICLIIFSLGSVYGYEVNPPAHVHQHITNESGLVLKTTPSEILKHLKTPLNQGLDDDFDEGNDIITGSGEEDYRDRPIFHFWQPDTAKGAQYDDGISSFTSSFIRGREFWEKEIIRNYTKGDIDYAYYFLGRLAHLIEDATVPAHVHLDQHLFGNCTLDFNDDALECNTRNTFINYKGSGLSGQQYNYENLIPSFTDATWMSVNPRIKEASYPKEFFKLFWYTAQKTQFFASDNFDGNDFYNTSANQQITFSPSLWQGEGVTIIDKKQYLAQDDLTNSGKNISHVANASVPHAMKTVAGLYRLFWDAVAIDWPTFHHDNRRIGFTLIRGDMQKASDVEVINLVLEGNVTQDNVARASTADLDGNGFQEIVVGASKTGSGNDGRVFAVEQRKIGQEYETKKKWVFEVNRTIEAPPSLGNIDSEKNKEVVFGLSNGTLMVLNISQSGTKARLKWGYTVPEKFSQRAGGLRRGELAFTAIEDVDLDGKKDIIFTDGIVDLSDWPGSIYILEDNGNSAIQKANFTIGGGGGRGAPSIADIDSDGKPEIIVSSFYGVLVFDFDNGVLTKKWNNTDGKIEGAIVVHDIDKDGQYEIIYNTFNNTLCDAPVKTCFNKLYIRNAETMANEGGSPIQLSTVARVTPAIGDIDDDGSNEMLVMSRHPGFSLLPSSPGIGEINCFELNGNTCVGWPYGLINAPFISPDIFDVDNDGKYEVMFPEWKSNRMFILKGDATVEFIFKYEGEIGSAPAIGDLDDDNVAEIAVKRAGSPITIMSTVTNFNQEPTITTNINTLTSIAGDLLNINESGKLATFDPENDATSIFYSSPFNESGHWQTSITDSRNFTTFVEVSDGNLSDIKSVDVIVFDSFVNLVNTFSDGSSAKTLSFVGSENKSVSVRLPKNATVIYSTLRIEGKT